MVRLFCVSFLAAIVVFCDGACPDIREWGRRKVSSPAGVRPANRVIIRDRPGFYCSSNYNCPTTIYDLQNVDIKTNGYSDIDCSVVVGGNGYVYEGRGWDAAPSSFSDSIVICVLENRNALDFPDDDQKQAIKDVLQCVVDNKKVSSTFYVQTPRDVDSSSVEPVQSLYNWVKTLKNYKSVSSVTGK